jgi:hypothetical protein
VSLEDRDWYRERPSDAWNEQWRRKPPPPSPPSGPPTPPQRYPPPRRVPSDLARAGKLLLVAIVVTAGVMAYAIHQDRLPAPSGSTAPLVLTPPVEGPTDVNLGDPKLWVRVKAPTKVGLSDPRFGTIEVVVGPGEVPATVLARALSARGYTAIVPATG